MEIEPARPDLDLEPAGAWDTARVLTPQDTSTPALAGPLALAEAAGVAVVEVEVDASASGLQCLLQPLDPIR